MKIISKKTSLSILGRDSEGLSATKEAGDYTAPASPLYILQVYAKQEKLQAVRIILESMDI